MDAADSIAVAIGGQERPDKTESRKLR